MGLVGVHPLSVASPVGDRCRVSQHSRIHTHVAFWNSYSQRYRIHTRKGVRQPPPAGPPPRRPERTAPTATSLHAQPFHVKPFPAATEHAFYITLSETVTGQPAKSDRTRRYSRNNELPGEKLQ